MTNRQPTRRERIVAMALQTESPAEAAVAQEKLRGDITILPRAQQALAEATSLTDMKEIHDFAVALRAGAKARGMGIEAENMAADLIIRAERKMGSELIRMAETGERALPSGKGDPDQARFAIQSRYDPTLGHEDRKYKTLSEIGVSQQQSKIWQRLAAIPEADFETLLDQERRSTGPNGQPQRLSRIDIIRTWFGTQPKAPTINTTPTVEDGGFLMLRAGAYALLGWQVNDDGKGVATKNGLLTLPDDELRQVARLVQALATAYGEAKSARG